MSSDVDAAIIRTSIVLQDLATFNRVVTLAPYAIVLALVVIR